MWLESEVNNIVDKKSNDTCDRDYLKRIECYTYILYII